MTIRVLVVDDHEPLAKALAEYLADQGFEAEGVFDARTALAVLEKRKFDLALVDMVMPEIGGMELLSSIRERHRIPVLMMTGFAEAGSASEAIQRGAYEFLTKPVAPEVLPAIIRNALDHHRLRQGEQQGAVAHVSLGALIGPSPTMQRVFQAVLDAATADTPVLILGETGTGKSLVAREIHARSARGTGLFVHLNCGAVAGSLFEAELFGYEKGAFTGAATRRPGRIDRAQGGTLFLDEIASLPLEHQATLLRVLQEREYERVGGSETLRADIRVVAASNHDLRTRVARGDFRSDLYFRLAAFPIEIPPLRDRVDDLPHLVTWLLAELGNTLDRDLPGVTPEAIEEAKRHPWPGNVRELRNALERAVLVCRGVAVGSILPPLALQLPLPADSSPSRPPELLEGGSSTPPWPETEEETAIFRLPLAEAQDEFLRVYLDRLLRRTGSSARAALQAGVDRRTLQRHLHRLGLRRFEGPGRPDRASRWPGATLEDGEREPARQGQAEPVDPGLRARGLAEDQE